jgi:2-oxoglutarate ferredoxin oxidoreductase subunit beta
MHPLAERYLRTDALPFLWCPGCGNGTILGAAIRAIDELEIIDEIALVGGIGCSGWIPTYLNADVMHALHGRAIPCATGLKMSDPSRKVLVFTGDGDCLGIGGNHFIHAARRNLDITVIMVNNQIYGMTGGQVAPTTPSMAKTSTSPSGNPELPFDACELAKGSGATYIARWTAGHPRQLRRAIKEAISHEGFAFVEVLAQCPTQAGRIMYGTADPAILLDTLTSRTVTVAASKKRSPQELRGKYLIGTLFKDAKRPEFSKSYYQAAGNAGDSSGT